MRFFLNFCVVPLITVFTLPGLGILGGLVGLLVIGGVGGLVVLVGVLVGVVVLVVGLVISGRLLHIVTSLHITCIIQICIWRFLQIIIRITLLNLNFNILPFLGMNLKKMIRQFLYNILTSNHNFYPKSTKCTKLLFLWWSRCEIFADLGLLGFGYEWWWGWWIVWVWGHAFFGMIIIWPVFLGFIRRFFWNRGKYFGIYFIIAFIVF